MATLREVLETCIERNIKIDGYEVCYQAKNDMFYFHKSYETPYERGGSLLVVVDYLDKGFDYIFDDFIYCKCIGEIYLDYIKDEVDIYNIIEKQGYYYNLIFRNLSVSIPNKTNFTTFLHNRKK